MTILKDVKQVLGVEAEDSSFDIDVMMHINSTLMILKQIGCVSGDKPAIDSSTEWNDLTPPENSLWAIQSYMYLRCRILFDPPSNSFVQTAIEKQISELEWRLNVFAESESK